MTFDKSLPSTTAPLEGGPSQAPIPTKTHQICLKNAILIQEQSITEGAVWIDSDGSISAVETGSFQGHGGVDQVIDCQGAYLAPGLIDLHTDNLEKHLQPRQRVDWPKVHGVCIHDAQVVGAGITTVYDGVFLGVTSNKPDRHKMLEPSVTGLLEAHQQDMLRADHRLHLRCEVTDPDMPKLLQQWIDHPLVSLLSIMDHAPGKRQCQDVPGFRAFLMAALEANEQEADAFMQALVHASEQEGPARALFVAEQAHQRGLTLATHDDQTLEHVAVALDLKAGISEFPVTLEAASAAKQGGQRVIMGAPNVVRGGSSSGNVSALDLIEAGHVDALVSDYVLASMLLALVCLVERDQILNWPEAIALGTRHPAAMVGLHDRGRLASGYRADLMLFQTQEQLPVLQAVYAQGKRVF